MFPEGRGFVGGWKILSSKLRSLGVSTTLRRVEEPKATSSKGLVLKGSDDGNEYSVAEVEISSSSE